MIGLWTSPLTPRRFTADTPVALRSVGDPIDITPKCRSRCRFSDSFDGAWAAFGRDGPAWVTPDTVKCRRGPDTVPIIKCGNEDQVRRASDDEVRMGRRSSKGQPCRRQRTGGDEFRMRSLVPEHWMWPTSGGEHGIRSRSSDAEGRDGGCDGATAQIGRDQQAPGQTRREVGTGLANRWP
jgi:hypothetical protein